MTIERIVRGATGGVVLLSLLLAWGSSHWWLLLTAAVGVNLVQSAFTDWCPLIGILRALGVPRCGAKAP